jgi:hypothetical protein
MKPKIAAMVTVRSPLVEAGAIEQRNASACSGCGRARCLSTVGCKSLNTALATVELISNVLFTT